MGTLADGPGIARATPRLESRDERRTLRAWAAYVVARRADEGRRNKSEESRVRIHVENDPIGDLYLEEVTPARVREWLSRRLRAVGASRGWFQGRRRTARLAPSTIRGALNLLRVILEEACHAGRLDMNPARGVQVPAYRARFADRRESKDGRALDVRELGALLEAPMPNTLRVAILVTLDVGWRLGEMAACPLSAIDLDRGRVKVRASWGGPPKSGKSREVKLLTSTVVLLRAYLPGAAPPEGELDAWCPFAGTKWTRRLGLLAKKAAIRRPVGWHDLRHTSAVGWLGGWWGEEALSVRDVQRRLGHASVTTTEGYAVIRETEVHEKETHWGHDEPVAAALERSPRFGRG